MALRIVRLGSPRARGEGLRIGTVRHPPRGVRKEDHARRNWYDVWFPDLAPSAALLKRGHAVATQRDWAVFARRFRSEMAAADKVRILRLLAALSHSTNLSVGCYCEDEARCHRSVLREILAEHGATLA
jgi:uncharacterized protein YeaO (DUF488 family)